MLRKAPKRLPRSDARNGRVVDELTELVEEAVYQEFERISERGGEQELMRSTTEEKDQQVGNVEAFRDAHNTEAEPELDKLQRVARERGNTFEALMEAGKDCSLGSMSHALYDVGSIGGICR
jgi:methylmalonyl-CoA mutase N-terminal domain/subunit